MCHRDIRQEVVEAGGCRFQIPRVEEIGRQNDKRRRRGNNGRNALGQVENLEEDALHQGRRSQSQLVVVNRPAVGTEVGVKIGR